MDPGYPEVVGRHSLRDGALLSITQGEIKA